MDLKEICGPLPSGGDLAGYRGYRGNLRLSIEGLLSFNSGGITWAVRIEKPTITKLGKPGKAKKVLILTGVEGTEPAVLLRQIANLWDQGTPMTHYTP